jgi:hypothetical protein
MKRVNRWPEPPAVCLSAEGALPAGRLPTTWRHIRRSQVSHHTEANRVLQHPTTSWVSRFSQMSLTTR